MDFSPSKESNPSVQILDLQSLPDLPGKKGMEVTSLPEKTLSEEESRSSIDSSVSQIISY